MTNLGDAVASGRDPSRTALIDLADPAAPCEWSLGELDGLAAAVARRLVDRKLLLDRALALVGEARA